MLQLYHDYLDYKEEADFIRHSAENYDDARFKEKQARFGTVVLECDLDMEPSEIYEAYSKRWEIETVMRYYKQACEFDETRVHSDYSVYGSEFVSFLSSLLTYRILNDSEKRKVLEEYSYGQMMERLRRAKKIKIDKEGFRLIRVNPSTKAPFRPWNSRKGAAGQKKAWKTQKELYIVLLVGKVLIK